jgi:hypothetical protein
MAIVQVAVVKLFALQTPMAIFSFPVATCRLQAPKTVLRSPRLFVHNDEKPTTVLSNAVDVLPAAAPLPKAVKFGEPVSVTPVSPAGAAEVQVVPLEVRTFPEVPGATT